MGDRSEADEGCRAIKFGRRAPNYPANSSPNIVRNVLTGSKNLF